MRTQRQVALVCEGPLSRSALNRIPRLRGQLGPVKAPSLQLASRLANALGEGQPATDFTGFSDCSLVLVSVPDTALQATLARLKQAGIPWRDKVLVLFDSVADTSALEEFRGSGASVGTLNAIAIVEETVFLFEGEPQALRAVRKLLLDTRAKAVQIAPGSKHDALRALEILTLALPALLNVVTESFRRAGVSRSQAESMLRPLILNAVRSHFRAGRAGTYARLGAEARHHLVRTVADALNRIN